MASRRGYVSETQAPEVRRIGGLVTIGASGAISAQTGAKLAGGTATQTASEDGRYTIAFQRTWKRVLGFGASMCGPADAAMPTTTGSDPVCRNVATTGMDIQTKRTDTQADADPASGTILCWWAEVARI